MAEFTIVLGNKRYSSWSLRGWLLLKRTGVRFEELVIPLRRTDTRAAIRQQSPSGRVPALKVGDSLVWDTLAIAEYLHERFPESGLWPEDPQARAEARAIAAEMHAGFATLRTRMPMDVVREPMPPDEAAKSDPDLADDIARIQEIWSGCRARAGGSGEFLFGPFGAVDAFFAPVASRFVTYGTALNDTAASYRDALMGWPDMQEWIRAAESEPWIIEYD